MLPRARRPLRIGRFVEYWSRGPCCHVPGKPAWPQTIYKASRRLLWLIPQSLSRHRSLRNLVAELGMADSVGGQSAQWKLKRNGMTAPKLAS